VVLCSLATWSCVGRAMHDWILRPTLRRHGCCVKEGVEEGGHEVVVAAGRPRKRCAEVGKAGRRHCVEAAAG